MLQKGIDEPLESHAKSKQTTFWKLQLSNWALLRSCFRGGRDLLKVTHGRLCACAINKTTINSDKNFTGQQEHIDSTSSAKKVNSRKLSPPVKSSGAGKSYIFAAPPIFLAKRSGSRNDNRTWFSCFTGHVKVLLLRFSLLWHFFTISSISTNDRPFLF